MGVDISISVIKMLSVQAEGTALVRAREPNQRAGPHG